MALALSPEEHSKHDPQTEPDRSRQKKSHIGAIRLFLILLSLVVDDVVEAELVDTLGGGDDTEPVTELLLLEVLLGAGLKSMVSGGSRISAPKENSQVLQVAAGEGDVSNDLDLALTRLGDHDVVTEVADTALDLDAVVEELLEGGDIENLVGGRLGSVDNELQKC
jgi:hypothetical protein